MFISQFLRGRHQSYYFPWTRTFQTGPNDNLFYCLFSIYLLFREANYCSVMTQSSWWHLSGQRRSTTNGSVWKFQHLTDRNWTHPAILKGQFWIVWQAPYDAHALSVRSAIEKKPWIAYKSIPRPWKLSVLTKIDKVRWMDVPNLEDHGSVAAWSHTK